MPLKPKSGKRGSKSASFEDNFSGDENELTQIIIANAKYFATKPPTDDDEAEQRIIAMFADCIENNSYPTIEKLAACLGITRQLLHDWEHNESKGKRRADMIKDAKEKIAAMDAEAVVRGKLNTVAYIFRAKNYYGLTDNVTVEHKATLPLGDSQDQSMLVGALLKQLQGQATMALPSDYQPQPDSATIAQSASDFRRATMIDVPSDSALESPATMAENASDFPAEGQATMKRSSDYALEHQATIAEAPSDYETGSPSDAERLSSDYGAGINPLTALGKALAEELAQAEQNPSAVVDIPGGAGRDPRGGA